MSAPLLPYDVTREAEMLEPLDFNRRSRLKHVDRVFKAEILNIIRLTDMEKLFQIRIMDPGERARFSFLPGQFVMLEVPGYGEIPISISSSPSKKGYLELCIRRAGVVTGALHRARRGAKVGIRGPFGSHFPMEKMKGHDLLLVAGGSRHSPQVLLEDCRITGLGAGMDRGRRIQTDAAGRTRRVMSKTRRFARTAVLLVMTGLGLVAVLSEDERHALDLRFQQSLSAREIAGRMDLRDQRQAAGPGCRLALGHAHLLAQLAGRAEAVRIFQPGSEGERQRLSIPLPGDAAQRLVDLLHTGKAEAEIETCSVASIVVGLQQPGVAVYLRHPHTHHNHTGQLLSRQVDTLAENATQNTERRHVPVLTKDFQQLIAVSCVLRRLLAPQAAAWQRVEGRQQVKATRATV